MKYEIFAVRDRALAAFMRPWTAQSVGQAVRMFQDECANKEGEIHKHPADYDLYHVGSFDDQDGAVKLPEDGLKMISSGKHYTTTKE